MHQGLICILDILGTKGIWSEITIDKYFQSVEEVENQLQKAKEYFKSQWPDIPVELDFLSFSDTLIVTLVNTKADELIDPYFFHEVISDFSQLILGIFQSYFSHNFFLRGAISFGQIEKRGAHFVGPAVDDAAEYFESIDMIGICLTPKASIAMDFAIDWNKKFNGKQAGSFLIKYKTPLKSKQEIDLYLIDWVKHFVDYAKSNPGISPLNTVNSFFSVRNIPIVAISKFTNTINFFNHISKNYR